MALSLPLLVAAALSVLTVHRFLNGPQGFNPENVLTMQLSLPEARYPTADTRSRFAGAVLERLRTVSGVDAAAAINIMPASGGNSGRSIEIDGRPNPDPNNPPWVDYRTATPELFTALQIPIRSGRGFTDGDREDTQPIAIVTESLAHRYWPERGSDRQADQARLGPVADGRRRVGQSHPRLVRPPQPSDDLPPVSAGADWRHGAHRQDVPRSVDARRRGARSRRGGRSVAAGLRSAGRCARPSKSGRSDSQYVGAVMLVFGGLALLLAIIGVYGVMAHMVTQRTHEIGVRMALGATRADVLRITVGQTGRLTAVGVGIGVVLSLLLGRLIEAGLLGVASSDARITAGLAAILVVSSARRGLPSGATRRIDRSDGRAQGRVTHTL